MTTPTTNLGLSAIQTEFGGSNPISMSEYYRGGANVPSSQATSATDGNPISTSGAIRFGMFRGVTKSVNLVISANTSNYNIFTAAGSLTSPVAVTVTVNSGIYVYASSTGVYGMTTGSGWHASSTITVINNGAIIGGSGAGGAAGTTGAGTAGSAGGPAFQALRAVTINNGSGTVGGGGGGGGGGGALISGKSTLAGGAGGAGRGGPSNLAAPTGGGGGSGGGAGGSGGALGAVGAAGTTSSYAGGGGGAAGACTSGNANITWSATGSRLGALG